MDLDVNYKLVSVDCDLVMFLLWVLCDYLNLIGMKFGCGVVVCGVCMVYVDGMVVWFCVLLVVVVVGKYIIIIEGFVGVEGKCYVL